MTQNELGVVDIGKTKQEQNLTMACTCGHKATGNAIERRQLFSGVWCADLVYQCFDLHCDVSAFVLLKLTKLIPSVVDWTLECDKVAYNGMSWIGSIAQVPQ